LQKVYSLCLANIRYFQIARQNSNKKEGKETEERKKIKERKKLLQNRRMRKKPLEDNLNILVSCIIIRRA